jgi:hypothetical protein
LMRSSFGFNIRFTSANFLVFFAFPISSRAVRVWGKKRKNSS